jgi:hypothetical protein
MSSIDENIPANKMMYLDFLKKLDNKSVTENDLEKLGTGIINKTVILSRQEVRNLKEHMNLYLAELPSQVAAERIREKFNSIFPGKQLKFKEQEVTRREEYPEEEEIVYKHQAKSPTIIPVDISPREEAAISYDEFSDKIGKNSASWEDFADFEDTLAGKLTKEQWKELSDKVRAKCTDARKRVAFSRLHQKFNPELYKGVPEITDQPPPKEKPLKKVQRGSMTKKEPAKEKPSGKINLNKFEGMFGPKKTTDDQKE